MKKMITAAALAGTLVFAGAGACDKPEPTPYRPAPEHYGAEDCDADDIAKKDWKDCPHLSQSPRPVKTTGQPAPTRTRRK